MHSKPITPEQRGNRSHGPRVPSSRSDLDRAEGEGMGKAAPDPSMSSDAQRHQARYGALSRNVMVFDLASEAKQLTVPSEAAHTARTLAKLDAIRLTLMKLTAGCTISEHQIAHQVSLETVSGRVVVHVEGQAVELPPGHVMVLARGVAHDIAARQDSVVLITVSAP